MENYPLPIFRRSTPNHEIQTNSHGDEEKRKKLEAEYQCLSAKNISEGPDEKVKSTGKKLEENKESRKQKFAFQTRSRVDILDDGYRWRKYGQKTVKDSTFPRFLYIISSSSSFIFSYLYQSIDKFKCTMIFFL